MSSRFTCVEGKRERGEGEQRRWFRHTWLSRRGQVVGPKYRLHAYTPEGIPGLRLFLSGNYRRRAERGPFCRWRSLKRGEPSSSPLPSRTAPRVVPIHVFRSSRMSRPFTRKCLLTGALLTVRLTYVKVTQRDLVQPKFCVHSEKKCFAGPHLEF